MKKEQRPKDRIAFAFTQMEIRETWSVLGVTACGEKQWSQLWFAKRAKRAGMAGRDARCAR